MKKITFKRKTPKNFDMSKYAYAITNQTELISPCGQPLHYLEVYKTVVVFETEKDFKEACNKPYELTFNHPKLGKRKCFKRGEALRTFELKF